MPHGSAAFASVVVTVAVSRNKLLARIRTVFIPRRPDIRFFSEELHYQSSRVAGFGAFLLLFVCLPYLWLDPLIHPGSPWMLVLRIGQSLMGLIALVAVFFDRVRKNAMYLVFVNLLYVELSGAVIAGLTGGDPVYTGGFALVLMITCLVPVPRMYALLTAFASVAVYAWFMVSAKLDVSIPRNIFALQLIVTSLSITVFFIFILDRIRHSSFEKTLAIQAARDDILKLSEFAQKANQSIDLNKILDEIIAYVQENFSIEGTLLQLYDPKTDELVYFKTNFQDFHDEDLRKYVQALRFSAGKRSSAGAILRRGKPMYFPNMKLARRNENQDPLDHFVVRAGIESALIVPLIVADAPAGMLYFSNYHGDMNLSRDQLSTIYAFCQQIGGAIHSSSLIHQVEREKEKSERLLLNILPESVALELKENGFVRPTMFENVTILFTDFKGFTHHAASMSPQDLVTELDGIFGQFDAIAEKYGLEKLKTIGDSYMCVGGLPKSNRTHPIDACLAGLEMAAFVKQANELRLASTGSAFWEIRVGVHTGSVVAGVIGKSKFAYDIWGDAVNVASRMESGGEPGRLNISGDTAEYVRTFFDLEPRGEVAVKNRGTIPMYFVKGLRTGLQDSNGRPGPGFHDLYDRLLIA